MLNCLRASFSNMRFKFFLLSIFLFVTGFAWAGPPVDLSNLNAKPEVEKPRPKALSEDDFIFTDPSQANHKAQAADLAHLKSTVVARSLPGRAGKALFKVNAGDAVKTAQLSKDKRWMAIYSLKARRKGWVPVSAVVLPTKKTANP